MARKKPGPEDPLQTIPSAAALLKFPYGFLKRLIETGKCQVVNRGNMRYIPLDEVKRVRQLVSKGNIDLNNKSNITVENKHKQKSLRGLVPGRTHYRNIKNIGMN